MSEDRNTAELSEPDLAAVAAEPTEVLSNVDNVEVSIVDDTPEGDKNRPARASGGEEDDIDEAGVFVVGNEFVEALYKFQNS